ncbi:hypothetical protein BDZ45DRAFT_730667 [Acephala macrosclerotiorum]|nr:hypothetical protein BDZ45DRAFT_730667 [Acephala macrosclerotiorum]
MIARLQTCIIVLLILAAGRVAGSLEARSDVNTSTAPQCILADCVASDAFSMSRLGCTDNSLTTNCFCHEAVTPLRCVSVGPSDENNCWAQAEDWMLNICGGANYIDPLTMPDCVADCFLAYLASLGCGLSNGTATRNCFCKVAQLDTKLELQTKMNECQNAGCWKKMSPEFSYEPWKDSICTLGVDQKYDQNAYNKHVGAVKKGRTAALVLVPLFGAVIAGIIIRDWNRVIFGLRK